jgi:hypothetical protein
MLPSLPLSGNALQSSRGPENHAPAHKVRFASLC